MSFNVTACCDASGVTLKRDLYSKIPGFLIQCGASEPTSTYTIAHVRLSSSHLATAIFSDCLQVSRVFVPFSAWYFEKSDCWHFSWLLTFSGLSSLVNVRVFSVRQVHSELVKMDRNDFQSLFLTDPSKEVPGYKDVIAHPMFLQALGCALCATDLIRLPLCQGRQQLF